MDDIATGSQQVGTPDRSLSVVVCAYTTDRWQQIIDAVTSLLTQTRPVDELILVVDHSPDLLAAARAEFTDASVTIVENSGPRGLSGARNTGVSVATGTVIAFLDDDATAAVDWAERLLAWYTDDVVIGAGGASIPVWSGGRPSWFPEEFDWVVGCTYRGLPEQPTAVRNLIGSNMSFRRSLFEIAGDFDSSVGRIGANPVGCEETEFCIRVANRVPTGRIMFDPAIRVDHHLAPSRNTWRYFRKRCFAEGKSKAIVAELVGSRRGLASERSYATRTLPAAVIRAIAEGVRTRRVAPFVRAGAVGAGLALTTAGYVVGRAGRMGWPRYGRARTA